MAKLALISNHLVLIDPCYKNYQYPVPGVIFIEEDLIIEIIILPDSSSFASILSNYPSFTVHDYTNYYISPGLIDLNCRIEWDNFENLTKEAVKGGNSLIMVESGYYQSLPNINSLYCDIGLIQVIDNSSDLSEISEKIMAVKGYLCEQGPNVKPISHFPQTLARLQEKNLSIFINPTMPDPRMLFMASPLRQNNFEERKNNEKIENPSNVFAAAFPDSFKGSSSDSISEDDLESNLLTKTASLQIEELVTIFHKKSNSDEDLGKVPLKLTPEIIVTEEEESDSGSGQGSSTYLGVVKAKRKLSHDIYNDLDNRIKANSQKIEVLCQAEASTYSNSGSTVFSGRISPPKKSCSMSAISLLKTNHTREVSETNSPPNVNRRPFRPNPIQIKNIEKPDVSSDYNYFLANCPEHWESAGIEKIAEVIAPTCKIHFSDVSSAVALNKIRKLKEKFKNITCEISACNLVFKSEGIKKGDTRFKNNPPIRNHGNHVFLWDLLKMKGINCICSQHASILPSCKQSGSFSLALNGISSIGLNLPSVWKVLSDDKIKNTAENLQHYIIRLAKWMSLHPAEILNVSTKRGSIAKGKFADLIVWDPNEEFVLGSEYRYHENSPFIGKSLLGKIKKVFIRGKLVFDEENFIPHGIVISRQD